MFDSPTGSMRSDRVPVVLDLLVFVWFGALEELVLYLVCRVERHTSCIERAKDAQCEWLIADDDLGGDKRLFERLRHGADSRYQRCGFQRGEIVSDDLPEVIKTSLDVKVGADGLQRRIQVEKSSFSFRLSMGRTDVLAKELVRLKVELQPEDPFCR